MTEESGLEEPGEGAKQGRDGGTWTPGRKLTWVSEWADNCWELGLQQAFADMEAGGGVGEGQVEALGLRARVAEERIKAHEDSRTPNVIGREDRGAPSHIQVYMWGHRRVR